MDTRPGYACDLPAGAADNAEDCDDTDPALSPGVLELCDAAGVDEDCDGLVNDADPSLSMEGLATFYLDEDRDDYGDDAAPTAACVTPPGYAEVAGDCDDTNREINPSAAEICDNGVDEDCAPGVGCGVHGTTDPSTRARTAKIAGEQAGDGLVTARAARDIDGDGYGDLLVGSAAAAGDTAGSGEAYLLYGPLAGSVSVEDADVRVPGEAAGDGLVPLMAGVDADGDRVPDVIVGAAGYDADVGRAYLVAGALSATEDLAGARIDWVGIATSDALGRLGDYGDFDGDRAEDLVVCGAGTIWVLDGPATQLGSQPIDHADATYTVDSVGSLDVFDVNGDGKEDLLVGDPTDAGGGVGSAVAAGDVDGDGYKDVAVGASMDGTGAAEAGAVYLAFGRFSADVGLAAAEVVLTGEGEGDHAGASLAFGDFDGNGVIDLIVGASGDDEGGEDAGAAYVLYGPISASGSLSGADAKLVGEDADERAGAAVGVAGDIDGDGIDDLFVSASGDDEGGSGAGAIYLFAGGAE